MAWSLVRTVVGCLLLVLACAQTAPVFAAEGEHRLGQGVNLAVGIGFEAAYGDYGSSADATVLTMPFLVMINPLEALDVTLELPLVYLNSRSGSGMVITQSGGGSGSGSGRGRGMARGGSGMMGGGTTTTTTVGGGTVTEAGVGDINLTAGWTLFQDEGYRPRIRPTLYLKVPSGDETRGLGTGTFEGGPGLSLSKWLGDVQLFGEGAWILQEHTAAYPGKNYASYSIGAGLQTTDRLFVSLYAKGASRRVEGGAAPLEGRLKLNFLQSRRIAWEVYAAAGFTDASPAVGGGVLVMYQF